MPTRRVIKWIAVAAIAWNAIGIASYLDYVGILGPAGAPMPAVVTAAFAIGVFAGAAGSLGLALLRPWAPALLWLSLIACIVNWGWVFRHGDSAEFPLGALVLVVAIILVILAEAARRQALLHRPAPR